MFSIALPLALAATWFGLAAYIHLLTRRGTLEVAGPRSMHVAPLPTGAGIVLVPIILAGWYISPDVGDQARLSVLLAAGCLALVSWLDDMVRLPAVPRLLAHTVAVGVCLFQLSPEWRAMPWLPLAVERLLEAVAWIWFINLFNFMDGIDGLAGSEAVAVTLGYIAIAGLTGWQGGSIWLAALIVTVMMGYLRWNLPPARVLMGDAGAIPLGFLLGWLILELAFAGYWASGLILPMYFCADATLTLLRRVRHGAWPSEPHREHFYQRAAQASGSHAPALILVAIGNGCLVVAALLSLRSPMLGIVVAAVITAALLLRLASMPRRVPPL